MNVHSINVLAVVCTPTNLEGSVYGKATIDGSGSFFYRIRVTDNGEPGTSDIYEILLSNGYFSGNETLEGGNVQIQLGVAEADGSAGEPAPALDERIPLGGACFARAPRPSRNDPDVRYP